MLKVNINGKVYVCECDINKWNVLVFIILLY